jgi:putative membrane protein
MNYFTRIACLGCLGIAGFAQSSQTAQGAGAATAQGAGSAAQAAQGAGAATAQGAGSAAQGAGTTAAQGAGAAGQAAQNAGAAATGTDTAVPGADKKFAMMVAQTDLAEIELGNMALQKSSDSQVKQLAQKIVDDHTKTSTAMKEIATKKGLTVPTEPDAKHKALATKLQAQSGKDFDKAFLKANSQDHHKVVSAFQKESNSGKDPDIKQFATQFLPAIQEHTTMIDQAKGQSSGGTQ